MKQTPINSIESIRQLFARGASLGFVFGLSQTYLLWHNSSADDLAEAFQIFHAHGMPASEVQNWIDSHFKYGLLDDLALDTTNRWREIGLDTTRYTDEFIKINAGHYISEFWQPPHTATDPEKARCYEILRRAGASPYVLARYE